MLGLQAGGTECCQALTVIVDDSEGHLPLDPTKQGVAFGHHANGHVHQQNLFSVVSGVVKFYYHHHKNKSDGSKATLTAKISEFSGADLPEGLKTCRNSVLTEYGVLFNITKDHRIIVDRTSDVVEEAGVDTVFRLTPVGSSQTKKRKVVKTNTPAGNTAKKQCPDSQEKKRKVVKTKNTAGNAAKKQSPDSQEKKRKVVKTKNTAGNAAKNHSLAKKKPTFSKKISPTKVTPEPKKRPSSGAGRRSSTRTTRRPAYFAAESNNQEDEEASVTSENDGNVIDLCSSSDEDDDSLDMDAPMSSHVPPSAYANQGKETQICESVNVQIKPETDDEDQAARRGNSDERSLEIENLNSTVISLQNENKSLKEEVDDLKQQLLQSKLALSVIMRVRVNPSPIRASGL